MQALWARVLSKVVCEERTTAGVICFLFDMSSEQIMDRGTAVSGGEGTVPGGGKRAVGVQLAGSTSRHLTRREYSQFGEFS